MRLKVCFAHFKKRGNEKNGFQRVHFLTEYYQGGGIEYLLSFK